VKQIDLSGQTAIFSGGAQGLGFAISRRRLASKDNSFTTTSVLGKGRAPLVESTMARLQEVWCRTASRNMNGHEPC
jgi:NAD(P)-dependent dehydrogenase (short-subunit alcohol dehydrogenase family)